MVVKRILSILVTMMLLISSMAVASAAKAQVVNVGVNYTAYDVTVSVEVPSGTTGKMIAQIVDENDTNLLGMQVKREPDSANSSFYTFSFTMPVGASTGKYYIRVGNNVELYERGFDYRSIDDVLSFYNDLITVIESNDGDINDFLNTPNIKWPLDNNLLNAYTTLGDSNVVSLVNAKIKAMGVATAYPASEDHLIKYDSATMFDEVAAIAEHNTNYFNKVMMDAISVAKIADSQVSPANPLAPKWSDVATAAINGTLFNGTSFSNVKFDDEFYKGENPLLSVDEVYSVFDTARKSVIEDGSLDVNDYIQAFSEATLLYIAKDENSNSSKLKEAFMHYVSKDVISPNMENINILISNNNDANLWKSVKAMDNNNIDDLINNVEEIAYNMVNPSNSGGNSGGGSGSGSGGGMSSITKPTSPTGGTGMIVPNVTNKGFSDIDDVIWAKEAIEYFAEAGVISGKSENKFCPNDFVTREEGAKIIANAFNMVENAAKCDFDDVANDRWSYIHIASAVRSGILQGDGALFRPTDTMTREEMATIFYRLYKLLNLKNAEISVDFKDIDTASVWAKEAIISLSGAGVINGIGDGVFAPNEPVTRAQFIKVAYEITKQLRGEQ